MNRPKQHPFTWQLTTVLACGLLVSACVGNGTNKTGTNTDSGTRTASTTPTTGTTNTACEPLAVPEMSGVFVSPNGTTTGTGTLSDPIDLVTAFSGDGPVSPGDTLWLAEGTYAGSLESNLTGTEAWPIIVRPHPGARVIIDTLDGSGLVVNGAWTEYWDFELMSSAGDRESDEDSSSPSDVSLGGGFNIFGANTKFINLEAHDTSGGFSFWTPAVDAEMYGNVIYNNGWTSHGLGH